MDPGSPASTIQIIEEFYGEPVSEDLIRRIPGTPIEQLLELADRLHRHGSAVAKALEHREFSEESRARFLQSGQASVRYEKYLKKDLACSDSLMLESGTAMPLQSMVELKRMILYSDSFVVPDDTFDWAEDLTIQEAFESELDELTYARALARFVRELLPIAPLIRSGNILTVPGNGMVAVGDSKFQGIYTDLSARFAYRHDPVLAWTVVNETNLMPAWEVRMMKDNGCSLSEIAEACIRRLRHEEPSEELVHTISARLWPGLKSDKVRHILEFAFLTREIYSVPVSANADVLAYLHRTGAVLLPGGDKAMMETFAADYAPAVAYSVPALSNTTLQEIINLRLNEELFHELRAKLIEVMHEVASSGCVHSSYNSYIAEVRNIAEDIIRPTYDDIERRRKKASIKNWLWEKATGGMVKLGINGFAWCFGISGPLAHGPAGAAGDAVGKAMNKSRRREQKDLEVAGTVLVSLLD
jgi:hypothetical protein